MHEGRELNEKYERHINHRISVLRTFFKHLNNVLHFIWKEVMTISIEIDVLVFMVQHFIIFEIG